MTRAPGRPASAASGRCAGGAYLERNRPEKFRETFSSGFAAQLLASTCQVDSLVPLLNAASNEKFTLRGNSIGILRWAGMAYAMGNGTEEAKVAARSVARSNANDGVAIALRSMMSRGEPWSVPQSERRPHCREVPCTQEPAK